MGKVSMLVPVFNRERLVLPCLMSLVEQTYSDLDILVYDDCSSDGTRATVRAINDQRIRLIEGQKHAGIAVARNVLLDSVETEFACWQDSDDVSNVHRIEILLNALRGKRLSSVSSIYQVFKGELGGIWKRQPEDSSTGKRGALPTILFRVDTSIRFNESRIWGGEDLPWKAAYGREHGQPAMVERILYYRRLHPHRLSRVARGFGKWDVAE